MTATPTPAASGRIEDPEFASVLDELKHAITWLRLAAIGIFVVAIGAAGIAAYYLPHLTTAAAKAIEKSSYSANMTLFEVVRGSAFAAAVTSVVIGLFHLARACIDQATRYQKRLVAAHFLNFVLHKYDDSIRTGNVKLPEVITFLDAWSHNVESAFTAVKFGSRKSQDARLSVGKDGVSGGTGSGASAA